MVSIPVAVPDLGVAGPIQLLNWLVEPGVRLIPGERMVELLADGTVFHLESPLAGTLAEHLAAPGTVVQVGETIARIAVQENLDIY